MFKKVENNNVFEQKMHENIQSEHHPDFFYNIFSKQYEISRRRGDKNPIVASLWKLIRRTAII